MRTRSLAKALSQALPAADGSPPPVRALMMRFDSPRQSLASNYAYASVTFHVELVTHDGAETTADVYKSRRPDGTTSWDAWPHAPQLGHDDISFRYSFDAKDPASKPLAPECRLTAYEPSLDRASKAVSFAERILTALRKLDDSQGVPASFPEAVARLMAVCEAQAVAVNQKDFTALTGREPPAWRGEHTYRLASSIPDARMMAEDTEEAVRKQHAQASQKQAEESR